jgi:hypothetical protein
MFQNFKVKICQFLVSNGRLVRSSNILKKQRFLSKAKDLSAPLRISETFTAVNMGCDAV